MFVAASSSFEAVLESGVAGLVPGLEISIIDNVGNTVLASSGVGIAEQIVDGSPTGIYSVTKTAPAVQGQYTIVWSNDGSYAPATVTSEDLVIVAVGSPLPPINGDDGIAYGPCSLWGNINDIAGCCDLPSDMDPLVLESLLTQALTSASELLYDSSGRQFAGTCERTVRPCQTDSCLFGTQILSRGHLVSWDGWGWGGYDCGCRPLSRIKLAGTVRSITEVTIDGVVVDPSEYRVDEQRWLVRLNGSRWPWCQSLDLPDDQPGTFAVTYQYGKTPPQAGQDAALQLSCEIFKACTNANDCALPTGVTRVTRQGVTFERSFLQRDPNGIWRSGLALVDLFLNTVNPHGLRRRATFWSPARRGRYARGAG